MKLAVFGATGKTGRLILEKALTARHEVTALVRDLAKLDIKHDHLRVISGAAHQPDRIYDAVIGAEAVICTISAGHGTLTLFGQNIELAMQRAGVSRIVSLIGASVPQLRDTRSIGRELLQMITRSLAGDMLADATRYAQRIEASKLAYTLIRPPRLTDGPATARLQHGLQVNVGPWSSISRSDLADFMLKVTVENLYAGAAPFVTHLR